MENTKKKILIIEDDPDLGDILKLKLQKENFAVLFARDGEEGLKLALAERPDLILLDIVLPKKDGLTLLKELREDQNWGKYAPVVLLSNLDDTQFAESALEKGAITYLVKSDWTPQQMVEKIRERLECQ